MAVPQLPAITDEYMKDRLGKAGEYTLLILMRTPKTSAEASKPIIWEHGRRNMALQAVGALSIVCPATDDSDLAGIGIFGGPVEEVREIIERDPAVQAGVLSYELHPVRGFPGDCLPG